MYKFLVALLFASTAVADPVTIGALLPLTGPFANYGEKIRGAFVTQAKSQGFNVITDDEGCDPGKAVTAYKKLTDIDKANIFFGPWCGSPQRVIAEQVKSRQQIVMLGSSAPDDLFKVSGGKVFSSQHTIQSESTYLAEQMNERSIKRVVIIYFDNGFSRAHEAAFRATFKGQVLDAFRYSGDELKEIVLKVKSLKPDAIYMPDAFPLLGGITKDFARLKINDIPVYGVYSFQFPDVLTATKGTGVTLIYSYPDIGQEDALEYFPKKATDMLFEAIKSCSSDTVCIGNYLQSKYAFGPHGALAGKFKLKTIKDGAFEDL